MGLQIQDYTLNNGLKSETAYVRIDNLNGNKNQMGIDVKIYISKEASEEGKAAIDQKFYSFVPDTSEDGENYHKQAYDYIRTLPSYLTAKDI